MDTPGPGGPPGEIDLGDRVRPGCQIGDELLGAVGLPAVTGTGVEGVAEQPVAPVSAWGMPAGGGELVDGVGDRPVPRGWQRSAGVGVVGEVVEQCLVEQAEALAGLL